MTDARPATLAEIASSRTDYVTAMACQIVHFSLWSRGFMSGWRIGERGHAGIRLYSDEPPTVRELFLDSSSPCNREEALMAVVDASGATMIQAQTNDPFLSPLLSVGRNPVVESVLFHASPAPKPISSEGTFRLLGPTDHLFEHKVEPVGDWVIEFGGEVVATGGALTHYNPPFVDLFMEVAEHARGRGFGSFLVNRMIAECRSKGQEPCARCNPDNEASRRTLLRAGMAVCGELVSASLAGQPLIDLPDQQPS